MNNHSPNNTRTPATDTAPGIVAPGAPKLSNLLETANSNGSFKTFGRAVEQAGMSDQLCAIGPFTIFAPTDAAFEKLPSGRLDTLFKPENKDELVSLVNYHVLDGRRAIGEIGKWKTATTRQGQSAPIAMAGKNVSIDGAVVTNADIGASNGLLHGIDKVNEPTRQ
jgi:uncharacterized surface protein with fasciclin (FAS1) repeats